MAARSKIQSGNLQSQYAHAQIRGGGGGGSGIPGKSQAIWVSVIGPSPEKVGSPGNVCTALKPWKMIVFFL